VVEEDSEEEDDDKETRVESRDVLATPGQIVAFVICGLALVAACLLCFAADTVCCMCDALCGHSRKNTNLEKSDDASILSQSHRAVEASKQTSQVTVPVAPRHAEPTEVLIHSQIPS
jgi:hypothetical protein